MTTAKEMGKKAYKNGLGQTPAMDSDFIAIFGNVKVGTTFSDSCNEWLNGWHEACDAEFK